MESSVRSPHSVTAQPLNRIEPGDALAAGRLLAAVWPRSDRGPAERAEQLMAMGRDHEGSDETAPCSFLVFDGEGETRTVIAHALVFPRTIGFEATAGADEITILALAMVATDASRRGEGLGALVVRAAFDLVDAGRYTFSLYQTSFPVEAFYERFGARRVTNRIYNSLSKPSQRGPSKAENPFWDDIVMRYPGGAGSGEEAWPDGDIDLRGAGY